MSERNVFAKGSLKNGTITEAGQPLLSIVITSFTTGRLKDIFELLASIKSQTYQSLETLFVAERSQELYERVREYGEEKDIPNLKVIFSHDKLGLSAARNLGIQEAQGDIVAFVDDDVVLFPDWAEEMVKTYEDEAIIGVTGPGFPLWEDESMSWLPEEFYWLISCAAFTGWSKLKAVRSAWGMNMSFRKEAFDYCRFSEAFGQTTGEQEAWKAGPGDDAEFSINLRLKTGRLIMHNPCVRVQHRVYAYRLTRKFIRGQAYWQGYLKALLKKLYPGDADTKALVRERDLLRRIILGLIPRSLVGMFRNPVLSWRQLSLTVTVLFYVALGYASGVSPWLGKLTIKRFK
ncbi:glycosyltransferase [bacterium]|nr:glycosyltransferase [bacterium]